jgi:hypothetical protein
LSGLAPKRRVLIVGEGRETEYNYFVGFRNLNGTQLDATATSLSVKRGKGGDPRAIVEHAVKEAGNFQPDPERGDRVFLLLDTEGQERVEDLPRAERLAEENGIEIVHSSPAFEYWLLCHFDDIPRSRFENCDAVIAELNKKTRWKTVCKTDYAKADPDVFPRLAKRLDTARDQALKIDLHYLKSNDTVRRANPSTQVYELIAILVGVRAGKMCPLTGRWKLIGGAGGAIPRTKGTAMPTHKDSTATWQFEDGDGVARP